MPTGPEMSTLSFKRADRSDIPFLVVAVTEAEASGSRNVSYREIFSLTDQEWERVLTDVFLEEVEGCGWSPSEFLIALHDEERAACCAAWVEGAAGFSSNIVKSQLLVEFLGKEKWEASKDDVAIASALNISRSSKVLQIESVYTTPPNRGQGLSGRLIREHLAAAASKGTTAAEIQLMKNNSSAFNAYQRSGFVTKSEKHSESERLLELLPYHTKIMMANY